MLKLWEKTEIVKIAVKKRTQNTNNELMANEIRVSILLMDIKTSIRASLTLKLGYMRERERCMYKFTYIKASLMHT